MAFNNILEVVQYFKDNKTCLEYLAVRRWGKDLERLACPHCNHDHVYKYKDGRFRCAKCKKDFTSKTGTIFTDSNISLTKWFIALYLLVSHKKGISSYQLHRDIKVTQKTAWFMKHRLRDALANKTFVMEKFKGTVETDELYVGGKEKNKHADKKTAGSQGRSLNNKAVVSGILQRGVKNKKGKYVKQPIVKATVVKDASKNSLQPEIINLVKKNSWVITDTWKGYEGLNKHYIHQTVNHSKGEYTRMSYGKKLYTNAIENYWSLFSRSIIGIYHHVSKKHLQKYLAMESFRYNTFTLCNEDRINLLLSHLSGRLTYSELISKDNIDVQKTRQN